MAYLGQCDRIRRTPNGEDLWQEIMKNRQRITKAEFLKHAAPLSAILDPGETLDQWMEGDPDAHYCKSVVSAKAYYLILHSGFEFIWIVGD